MLKYFYYCDLVITTMNKNVRNGFVIVAQWILWGREIGGKLEGITGFIIINKSEVNSAPTEAHNETSLDELYASF